MGQIKTKKFRCCPVIDKNVIQFISGVYIGKARRTKLKKNAPIRWRQNRIISENLNYGRILLIFEKGTSFAKKINNSKLR